MGPLKIDTILEDYSDLVIEFHLHVKMSTLGILNDEFSKIKVTLGCFEETEIIINTYSTLSELDSF